MSSVFVSLSIFNNNAGDSGSSYIYWYRDACNISVKRMVCWWNCSLFVTASWSLLLGDIVASVMYSYVLSSAVLYYYIVQKEINICYKWQAEYIAFKNIRLSFYVWHKLWLFRSNVDDAQSQAETVDTIYHASSSCPTIIYYIGQEKWLAWLNIW